VKRREFITLIGGAGIGWPLAVRAQQPAMPVVGFLNGASPDGYAPNVAAFLQGLKETGYIEGHNVTIEYRWAQGQYERLPGMATDLVRRQVAVIVANTPAAPAAKAATATIPVVFATSADPVAIGLVASLNRPGGNLTGVVTLGLQLGQKQLELLHGLVPEATTMALVINPTNPAVAETQSKELQTAARALGLQLHVLYASTEQDFGRVFATAVQLRAGGLVIGAADPMFISRSEQLAALALRHALPAIFQYREFAAAGGLMSYGASIVDLYRQAGIYAGKILNGAKPSDLPVLQSPKFELVINLKTAKALGITVPMIMQMTADEVIE
jgi:putative tryptophan/tyrosine transport system substrate-binding protein